MVFSNYFFSNFLYLQPLILLNGTGGEIGRRLRRIQVAASERLCWFESGPGAQGKKRKSAESGSPLPLSLSVSPSLSPSRFFTFFPDDLPYYIPLQQCILTFKI